MSDEDRVSRATFIRPRMYVLVSNFESSGAERFLEAALVTRRPHRKGAPGPECSTGSILNNLWDSASDVAFK